MRRTAFKDLTPVDNADPEESYAKALLFAIQNPKIKNIAITGPYGSGKSSIIKTFEKNHSTYNFLNISLASFRESENISETRNTVERSILQQMLFGADANKLPYSRFKKISVPEIPLGKAFLFVIWLIAIVFFVHDGYKWLSFETHSIPWWIAVMSFTYVVSFMVLMVSDLYKASFNIHLKKLSLKNAEIEIGEISENSILNQHLDEIIYFFQETRYDVVVIEDLDRFGDPEIFVKLREINKLINSNAKTHGKIVFLYAIKDDMFAHSERTKFFDFIIPVIPIINISNSLDKMQERLAELDLLKRIDSQFLREVSLYINDFRLIHNIFNEFTIYRERLNSEHIDATKLLAMMIYKNVYPKDFEDLHHGKGLLFSICKKKAQYAFQRKEELKEKVELNRNLINSADEEKARSISELISTYVGKIISHANSNSPVIGIFCDNEHISFTKFTTYDRIKCLFNETNINLVTHLNVNPSHRYKIGKSFSDIEEEINPGETFLDRKRNIENNIEDRNQELLSNIRGIEKVISNISKQPLHRILQNTDFLSDVLTEKPDNGGNALLIYLVKNGYLDDNYHIYISNFHEGRLTKNDRDYLLTIRNFSLPDSLHKIDTPEEVCFNMRLEDFGDIYALNVYLIDYLLDENDKWDNQIQSTMRYIAENYSRTEKFLSAYFENGIHLKTFIRQLSHEWPDYSQAAISSNNPQEQIFYILKYVDSEYIVQNMNNNDQLTNYLSGNGHLVFSFDAQPLKDYGAIRLLNVRFHDLTRLKDNKEVVELSHNYSLYILNATNVNFILHEFPVGKEGNASDINERNYSTIQLIGSKELKRYVEDNLITYIEKVFLKLSNNNSESGTSIRKLLNHSGIDDGMKQRIISKQDHVFDELDGLPENLWGILLREEKIAITWSNLCVYINNEKSDESVITALLMKTHIVNSLSNQNFEGGEYSKKLSKFILDNEDISISDYEVIVQSLPFWYQDFPTDITNEKATVLAEKRVVRLEEKSFDSSESDKELTAILIIKNFKTYLENRDIYTIDDEIRVILLKSNLSDQEKLSICLEVTPYEAETNIELSMLVSDILLSNDVDLSFYDEQVLASAIINAKNVSTSITLLLKALPIIDEANTMDILSKLPSPYDDISSYGKRPKLDYNELNNEFAELLEKQGYISSIRSDSRFITINTFKSSDHHEEV